MNNRNQKVLKHLILAILIPTAVNIPILLAIMLQKTGTVNLAVLILLLAGSSVFWLWFSILPYWDHRKTGIRLKIMIGGRTLCLGGIYAVLFQLSLFIFVYPKLSVLADGKVLWVNSVFSMTAGFLLLWNGILRIFFTSRRLNFSTRVVMLLAMWIPVVNLLVLLHALALVRDEYDFACYKNTIHEVRAQSDLCKTKYPLIMVHGVGFRDLHYFNYWGRIPNELIRYGATVYYGNQEAFGTVAYNAEDIKKRILNLIAETGCEKVNIIAHSKGGLDSRYAISLLGMDQYTASLTTVNTPHHGCRFVDYACRLPDSLYHMIARYFDWTFHKFGDRNPDFYTATHQFSTTESRHFNEEVKDSPNVCYQSYTSMMKYCFSDTLLTIPYCLIWFLEGPNDGLVSIASAKWGNFRGIIHNKRSRGISHGDIIDLKREDYKGFDIIEQYVQIVSELKEMGY